LHRIVILTYILGILLRRVIIYASVLTAWARLARLLDRQTVLIVAKSATEEIGRGSRAHVLSWLLRSSISHGS
jgi:hypothetical protein